MKCVEVFVNEDGVELGCCVELCLDRWAHCVM